MSRFDQIRRQVPDSDPEYRELLGRADELSDASDMLLFGEEVLTIQESGDPEDQEELEQFVRLTFTATFLDLHMIYTGQVVRPDGHVVMAEAEKLMNAPKIREELVAIVEDGRYGRYTPALVVDAIRDSAFSTEALLEALQLHREHIQEQQRELEAVVEEMKADFTVAIQQAVEAGALPPFATASLHRLDTVTPHLIDLLREPIHPTMGSIDEYNQLQVNSVRLAKDQRQRLRSTLYHEFLHVISGHSNSIVPERNALTGEQRSTLMNKKSGVALYQLEGGVRHLWLNEAITEFLTLRLLGDDLDTVSGVHNGSDAYPRERQTLEALIELGVDEAVLWNAYFENFTSDQTPAEGKGQHFARLVQELNEKVRPGALLRLDNQHILERVTDMMSTLPEVREQDESRVLQRGDGLYRVQVTVGGHEDVRMEHKYTICITGYDSFARERQQRSIDRMLSSLQEKYGRQVHISTVYEG